LMKCRNDQKNKSVSHHPKWHVGDKGAYFPEKCLIPNQINALLADLSANVGNLHRAQMRGST
jgi:hypothetical protein